MFLDALNPWKLYHVLCSIHLKLIALEKKMTDKLDELTADFDTLTGTVTSLTGAITTLTSTIAAEDVAVTAAIAALGGIASDPRVQTLIDAVTAQQANIATAVTGVNTAVTQAATDTANLTTALNPPPPPPAS